jgi:hypothetical protein
MIIIISVQFSTENENINKFSMFGKNTVYKKFLDYKQIPNKQYEIEIDDFSFREETFNEKDIMITIWVIGKYKSFIISVDTF